MRPQVNKRLYNRANSFHPETLQVYVIRLVVMESSITYEQVFRTFAHSELYFMSK